ncbi:MAG: asparagine synthase B [Bacteriovoracaceae bacterium]
MCGIMAVIGKVDEKLVLEQSRKMKHRGPDDEGIFQTEAGVTLCHQRLSIIDLKTGHQPLVFEGGPALVHNGEIYNHEKLWEEVAGRTPLAKISSSDSEIIAHLYKVYGKGAIHKLDGVFAFVYTQGNEVFAGRDPMGVKPLYYGHDSEKRMWFSSETKSLLDVCESIEEFPPGHFFTPEDGFVKFYCPLWEKSEFIPKGKGEGLKEALESAVEKRLMSDVPLGVLLSGGLDSSLVASITARMMEKKGKKIKSFSVGLSPEAYDLKAARKVAEHIGSDHHEILFSVEEGIEALEELILKLESYDVTTIRSATPMYLMMKKISELGVKVVMSGEGADEILGGYMYFHNAPSFPEFHEECVRRVNLLYSADVLRADRATMGAGIEARVPFLDLKFLDESMGVTPELKQPYAGERIEKWILRQAFDDKENPYLPDEILWRQKEQFQDGVGYSWVDGLKAHAEKQISDEEFSKREKIFSYQPPESKEAFYYRKIFSKHFKHESSDKLIKRWIPKWQDDEDTSGRASKFHQKTVHSKKKVFKAS